VARYAGAKVIAIVRGPEKAGRITALGAGNVIDSTSEDVIQQVKEITNGRGVDLIFDTVGGDGFEKLATTLRPGGRIVIPGTASGEALSFRVSPLIYNQATIIFSKGSRPDEAEKVLGLHACRHLKAAISHVFRLDEAAEAHRVLERRQQVGRVVLDVAGLALRPNV
jgi:NADPH2:quinone reductase